MNAPPTASNNDGLYVVAFLLCILSLPIYFIYKSTSTTVVPNQQQTAESASLTSQQQRLAADVGGKQPQQFSTPNQGMLLFHRSSTTTSSSAGCLPISPASARITVNSSSAAPLWRCPCGQGISLPAGIDSARAIFRMGSGECYHKAGSGKRL